MEHRGRLGLQSMACIFRNRLKVQSISGATKPQTFLKVKKIQRSSLCPCLRAEALRQAGWRLRGEAWVFVRASRFKFKNKSYPGRCEPSPGAVFEAKKCNLPSSHWCASRKQQTTLSCQYWQNKRHAELKRLVASAEH